MKTLTSLLALFALATASEAKILVYKGALTTKSGPLNIRQNVSSFFMLIDSDANKIDFVTFFVQAGQKRQQLDSPLDIKRVTADIAAGRSATTISLETGSPPNGNNFTNGLFYLRGTNSTLKVSTTGLTTLNLPRVLTGTNVQTGVSGGIGFFAEQRYVVSYQDARTIKANDASQTIAAAAQAISDELTAKGFKP